MCNILRLARQWNCGSAALRCINPHNRGVLLGSRSLHKTVSRCSKCYYQGEPWLSIFWRNVGNAPFFVMQF